MADDLTPTRAAQAAGLAMRRRPTPTVHDLALTGPQRALATFKQLQPQLAGRFADSALLAAAQGTQAPTACRWHLARALAKRWGLAAPTYTVDHLALLRRPCGPACRAQIDPKPRPKPRAAPTRAAPPGRRLPATPAEATARLAGPRPTTAAADAQRRGLPSLEVARYNLAALERMGIDPARYPQLVLAR